MRMHRRRLHGKHRCLWTTFIADLGRRESLPCIHTCLMRCPSLLLSVRPTVFLRGGGPIWTRGLCHPDCHDGGLRDRFRSFRSKCRRLCALPHLPIPGGCRGFFYLVRTTGAAPLCMWHVSGGHRAFLCLTLALDATGPPLALPMEAYPLAARLNRMNSCSK
jgi:hypothetical protein